MPKELSEVIALTGVLTNFRNIYVVTTFAILGFVIQRKGYRSRVEKYTLAFGFLFFGLGNLFQIWQTSCNIDGLAAGTEFKYVTPTVAVLSHLPFDIVVFSLLLFVFKIKNDQTTAPAAAKDVGD